MATPGYHQLRNIQLRVLGVSRKWPKLYHHRWTSFRFHRADFDYYTGEVVQVVLRPRSSDRQIIGIARIIRKEVRIVEGDPLVSWLPVLTHKEAQKDGFPDKWEMILFLQNYYGEQRIRTEPMNKLTLEWPVLGRQLLLF